MEITLIVAMDENRAIGKDNKLPWNLPGDRKMFRIRTEGGTVIMGRKTYESILDALGKPLPGRKSIVLTRNKNYVVPAEFQNSVFLASSWEDALLKTHGTDEVFVIGGEEIYRLALPHAEWVIITRVATECDGDTFFPELSDKEWDIYYWDREGFHKQNPKDEYAYQVVQYKRRAARPAVDMDNARLPDQRAAMERIASREYCPFCPENLALEHKQPTIKEGMYWLVTKNQWPYKNTRIHLLLILKKHAENIGDIPADAYAELGELLRWLEAEYEIPGGGVCMRFGGTEYSGGTVRHIHAQIVVPDLTSADYQPTFFQIGSQPKTT
ncbi:MAG: dihydrofolate reductase [Parcubacteria group bacterium]|nr:dihydrofolate reductase [Candidatus Liptonbacteria bacterium]MBI3075168.1 dihydrofolate reductase [Parcubacteria group bacterium]